MTNIPAQQQPAMPASVSIIDNVNLNQVQLQMQKIAQFQAVVQKTLKKGHDYGEIPGTRGKPTLLKPGAEKILMLLGLSSEYEIVERVQDYEQGFFAFTVKCILSRNGLKVTEGVGHANTREKRYQNQDPFSLANTVLKMAKKRAQVDAVLTVASLSEIFTQDLEDFADEPVEVAPRQERGSQRRNGNGQMRDPDGPATEQQMKAVHAIANRVGLSDDELRSLLTSQFGVTSTKELTKGQASKAIDMLQNTPADQLRQLAGTAPAKDQADDLFGGSEPVDIADDDMPFE